jgi:hypothetical protein
MVEPFALTSTVFKPLPYKPGLVEYYQAHTPFLLGLLLSPQTWWEYQRNWDSPWDTKSCFDICTAWFLPPEITCQAITFILETWSERPLTTSFIFFVPRVVQAFWWGLSHHIKELGTNYPHKNKLPYPHHPDSGCCVAYSHSPVLFSY